MGSSFSRFNKVFSNDYTQESKSKNKLTGLVICGPSGVGKGTLLNKLFQLYSDRFGYSVSHTTRPPRPGETHGKEYYFIDNKNKDEIINKMKENNEFLELCEVHGNYYGTTVEAVKNVQKQKKVCVVEIDIQGAEKIKAKNKDNKLFNLAYIFITAPIEVLRERIKKRGAESDEILEKRINTASKELSFVENNPSFFYSIIENDDFDTAFATLVETINRILTEHGDEPLPVQKKIE